ncbi:hypothetical protein [Streptomyces mirabilis]|uniref:hypothetical protein n=1 Tax=Streptomyces mirabilis TaxID=68239 RepID=UPI00324B0465
MTSSDDERSVNVTATPQGKELLGRVMPGHVAVVRRLLVTPLNRSDITTLSDLLGRVRTHMRTTPPRSATPGRKPTTLRND